MTAYATPGTARAKAATATTATLDLRMSAPAVAVVSACQRPRNRPSSRAVARHPPRREPYHTLHVSWPASSETAKDALPAPQPLWALSVGSLSRVFGQSTRIERGEVGSVAVAAALDRDVAEREQHHDSARRDDRAVGDVEHRPVRQL